MNRRPIVRPVWSRRIALSALLLVGTACETPTAVRPEFAYDPTSLSRGLLYRWASGRRIAVWAEVDNGATQVDLDRATRQAIASWNAIPDFREFELVRAASLAEADLVVYDRANPMPLNAGSCAFDAQNSAGYTYFCPTGSAPVRAQPLPLASGGAARATVLIRVDRGRVSDQNGYNALVAHEFGHALGIGGHSDDARDLMFGLPTAPAPTPRDAQTLRHLLGRRPDITL